MNQLMNMLIRMVMRRGLNAGINRGVQAFSKMGQSRTNPTEDDQGTDNRRNG